PAEHGKVIIPIDQDPQATVFHALDEPERIVTQTGPPRGKTPRFRDDSTESLEEDDRVVVDYLDPTLVPTDQTKREGAPRSAQIELANQQTRPPERPKMDPHRFLGRHEHRRPIAGDVAHLELAVVESSGEPPPVSGQGQRARGN